MGGIRVLKQRCQQPEDHSIDPVNQNLIWRPWENDSGTENLNYCSQLRCNYDACEATFRRESERRRHEESVHSRNIEICPHCDATFTRKDNLTRHIKMKHRNTPNCSPRCQFCNKKLSRRDAVQRHESTCSRNPEKAMSLLVRNSEYWEREH